MTQDIWLTTAEAARIFSCRAPKSFLKILTEHGHIWDPDAKSPSRRIFELKLAKRDPNTREWLWLAPFVSALGAYLQWRECVHDAGSETPTDAVGPFVHGINQIGFARPDWKSDAQHLIETDPGYQIFDALRDERGILKLFSTIGIKATTQYMTNGVGELSKHVDVNNPSAKYGLEIIAEAHRILDKIGPQHPYVRFGLLSMEEPGHPFSEPPALKYENFKAKRKSPV